MRASRPVPASATSGSEAAKAALSFRETSVDDGGHEPSASARDVLAWADGLGATTLGDAIGMLDMLEDGADAAEVLGLEGQVEDIRSELEAGADLAGAETDLADLL
jgi:hypothetical protein